MLRNMGIARLAALLVGSVLMVVGVGVALAQAPVATRVLIWDHSGLDVAGGVDVLEFAEYSVYPKGSTPGSLQATTYIRKLTPPDEDPDAGHAGEGTDNPDAYRSDEIDVSGLAPGVYDYAVRVHDNQGNVSEWALGFDSIDLVPPAPPGNVRQVRVTVTVEVLTE